MTESEQQAYDEGLEAAEHWPGWMGIVMCPYVIGSAEGVAWRRGYKAFNKEAAA